MNNKWHNCNGNDIFIGNRAFGARGPMLIHHDLNNLFIKAIDNSGYRFPTWPVEMESLDTQVRGLVANVIHESIRGSRG